MVYDFIVYKRERSLHLLYIGEVIRQQKGLLQINGSVQRLKDRNISIYICVVQLVMVKN